MEPRPSRPSRATGQSSTRTTRTPWTPSPTVEPTTSQRTADIYSAPQSQSGGQWYGQQGPTYAPEQSDYRQTGPMTPIKPRNERGNKLLRYLLAALLLIGVIGGGAYAITRYLDNNDDSPESPAVAAVTEGSVTPTMAATEATDGQQDAPAPTTAAAAPTATTAAEATEASTDETVSGASTTGDDSTPASGDSADAGSTGSAEAFLPAASDLDGSWTVTDEGERTKTEVGEQIGADGEELLSSWRWRENFYRDLTRDDPTSFPDETTFVNVSVHRFANADGASAALTALSDIVVEAQGLQEVDAPAVGDSARALSGPGDGVNLYVLYVQDGKYLLRLGGASATGDPSATVNALAEQILSGQDTSA